MIIVKVEYTVKGGYVEINKKNIKRVMSDLRDLQNDDIKYSSFLKDDGATFMHFVIYPDEATMRIVTELPSFKQFQSELRASDPVSPPQVNNYSLVASSYL